MTKSVKEKQQQKRYIYFKKKGTERTIKKERHADRLTEWSGGTEREKRQKCTPKDKRKNPQTDGQTRPPLEM